MSKREKGYIYIFTILLISLLAIFFYFIYSYMSGSTYISKNRLESLQANYALESTLNIKISQDDFQKDLEDFIFKDSSNKLKIKKLPEDTELLSLNFKKEDYEDEKNKDIDLISLKSQIKYKDTLVDGRIRGHYINKIYKEEDGILNSSKVNGEALNNLREKFACDDWTDKNNKKIYLDGDFIYDYQGGKYIIFEEIELYDEESDSYIKKLNPLYDVSKKDIIIQKSGTLKFLSSTRGQIFIINDKVVFNDNTLSGIIILKENAQIANTCTLNGYLIDLYDRNSGIGVKYSSRVFSLYGYLLPEYIKFQPISLNYYDIEDNT
ncbi:hypothetical protein I6I93_00905 [Peptoniphilus harei]|uniref:Uncharacterized protein n=1 Tax=Peptoniphilus harei TaxID=54005 RepID=A0A2X1Y1I0_9FIRM|nr:hypothetical protein [Peptoniphilus harei]QQT91188.1 hypothetical protein I6I93_00905 [Peptoniphilus harei]SPY48827.1 Uncharacterised protein [Peptoniphilus harei]